MHHSQLDQRSLELHHRIAKKIRQQPALLDVVRHNIERFQAIVDPRSRPHLDAWQQALNQGMDALLALATEDSERATELQQSSPFPGVLSEPERLAFLSEWHRAHPDPERRPPQHFSPMTPHIPPPVILDRARARGVKFSELLETSRQQPLAIAGLSLAYIGAPDVRIFLASERANYRLPDGVVIVGCQLPEKAVAIDVPTSIRALEVLAHGFHDQEFPNRLPLYEFRPRSLKPPIIESSPQSDQSPVLGSTSVKKSFLQPLKLVITRIGTMSKQRYYDPLSTNDFCRVYLHSTELVHTAIRNWP